MSSTGKEYWRSIEERADAPGFSEWLHREFPEAASMLDSSSRRSMLKLMAASFGLAGLTACSRPVENILPASKGVEDYVPGNPLFYATVMSLGAAVSGLVVESHDGRPTKIEGNPEHPASGGACSAFAQASVLGLYDPDRSRMALHNGAPSSWDEFLSQFTPERLAGGAGLRFLSQSVNSPSLEAVRAYTLRRFPKARWVEYEPISRDEELAGADLAFGRPLQPHYYFDKADVVLSLDCDFLALDSPAITCTRDFARRRRVTSAQDSMNRLYVVESQFSVTGGMADHRLRLRSSEVGALAVELAKELGADLDGAPRACECALSQRRTARCALQEQHAPLQRRQAAARRPADGAPRAC